MHSKLYKVSPSNQRERLNFPIDDSAFLIKVKTYLARPEVKTAKSSGCRLDIKVDDELVRAAFSTPIAGL